MLFQSLNRAYKRSDEWLHLLLFNQIWGFNPSIGLTSVPTEEVAQVLSENSGVSIPQSGLQAFRRWQMDMLTFSAHVFQSLNRAYKRSDRFCLVISTFRTGVSIPQSGLQAFRPRLIAWRSFFSYGFNPSIGLTSVPTFSSDSEVLSSIGFQSLNRAYKRSDEKRLGSSCGLGNVSIPQSGLQAFRHKDLGTS